MFASEGYTINTTFDLCFFPGVFLSSRVTGACPVTTDLILRVNVRTNNNNNNNNNNDNNNNNNVTPNLLCPRLLCVFTMDRTNYCVFRHTAVLLLLCPTLLWLPPWMKQTPTLALTPTLGLINHTVIPKHRSKCPLTTTLGEDG